MNCLTCKRELKEGMDVLKLEEGIVSVSGVVAIEDPKHFCSIECLKRFFTPEFDYYKLPRRIP